jgi:hypothetical protein
LHACIREREREREMGRISIGLNKSHHHKKIQNHYWESKLQESNLHAKLCEQEGHERSSSCSQQQGFRVLHACMREKTLRIQSTCCTKGPAAAKV